MIYKKRLSKYVLFLLCLFLLIATSLSLQLKQQNKIEAAIEKQETSTTITKSPILPSCPPVLTSPVNGSVVTTTDVTFKWKACRGAVRYQWHTTGITSFPLATTSHTVGGAAFIPGSSYVWEARGCTDTSCTNLTSWSDSYTFWYQFQPTPTPPGSCHYSGGYCYLMGGLNKNCNSVCNSVGKTCVFGNWNDDTSCTMMKQLGNSCTICVQNSGSYAPFSNDDGTYCRRRYDNNNQQCGSAINFARRLCKCE